MVCGELGCCVGGVEIFKLVRGGLRDVVARRRFANGERERDV